MLPVFELEQYLLLNEPMAMMSLCASGMDSLALSELLALADEDCRAMWDKTQLEYALPQGAPFLKEIISTQYTPLSAENICIFAGAAEALFCVFTGLLQPEDHVIVITPCYQSLASIPESRCVVTRVGLASGDASWQLDLDAVVSAIQPRTKMVVINFPHNPTGALPERHTLLELIEICRQNNLYLLSDEVYRLMEIEQGDRLPPIAQIYEKGISVSSMSKPYGLPGLRIGWVAASDSKVIDAAVQVKHYTSICPNTTGETLALIALKSQAEILGRQRETMLANRTLMTDFFEAHPHLFRWQTPKGGCLGFPELLAEEPADRFATHLLQETGLLILPGTLYQWPGNYFRISYAKRNLPEALARFAQFCADHFQSR